MKKVVTFGELMMRLSTEQGEKLLQSKSLNLHYGGGEANVAVSLAQMGVDASFVSALPLNETGESALSQLKKFNVSVNDVVRQEGRLGLYFLEQGSAQRHSNVIYDRDSSVFANCKTRIIDWDKAFDRADWFHWSGISPAVSENAALLTKEAVEAASSKGLTISVDLNYRSKLWKYGKSPINIMPDLVKHCHVLVGNEGHNNTMLGIPPVKELGKTDEGDLEEACKRVTEQFENIHTVAIAMRDNISASHNELNAALYRNGSLDISDSYEITPIIDRIGGGDAFMAGLIYGLNKLDSNHDIINFAVAASVLKHSIKGDFNLATASEVMNLMNGNSGSVSR